MPHKKSILHIFQSLEMGGAQTRFMQMMQHKNAANYHHSVFALNGCYDLLNQFPDDAIRPEICTDLTYEKGAFFKNLLAFRKVFKSKKYDLVQTQNWPTVEAVIANSPQIIPHIHNEDGFGADEAQKLKTRRNIIRRLFLMGKKLIVPSMVLKNLADRFWNTPFTHIHYVANGIADVSVPSAKKEQSDKIVFVTVAMLRREKNIEAMLDMVAFLKAKNYNIILKIVGSGPEEERLKEYAKSLKLTETHVIFLGFKSDYMDVIHDCDIFLLSSHTEQQPYSILQAMAAEKPILSTNVGDVYNMVSADNRDFVSQEAFKAPYILAQKLVNDRSLRQALGMHNKVWQKEHYDIEISLKKRYEHINILMQ